MVEVARALVGMHVRHGEVRLRITEVEAYGPHDTACHAFRGRTARNRPMFGPPGRAYVYLCYGLHQMLNVVTGPPGEPAAVLIRACQPVRGQALIRARRGGRAGPGALDGPGKVGAALAIDTSFSDQKLYIRGALELHRGTPPRALLAGPRIGIQYAEPHDRDRRWRFVDADTAPTHRRGLSEL